ncbi:MAG TPA: alpha/beta hydrolase, partial [Thermoanaerobaculia bacterium]|nr:alpha/beta hydrolase [Thermoanaerobaculia bacterium]
MNWTLIFLEGAGIAVLAYVLKKRGAFKKYQRKPVLEQRIARLGRNQISYLRGSKKGPTVLLLHGFAADKEQWLEVAPLLEQADYQVVAPDLPGFGANFRDTEGVYDAAGLARQLRAFAKEADLGMFHLVGHGIGAIVAASYAYAFPVELASLTLIEPLGIAVPIDSELDRQLKAKRNPFLVGSAAAYDSLLAFVTVTPPVIPAAKKKQRAEALANDRPFYTQVWSKLMEGDRGKLLDLLLPEIKVRTLAVFGGKSRVVNPMTAKMIERRMEHNASTVVIPDCGHWIEL